MRLASMVSQRPLSSAMSVVKVERSAAPTVTLVAGATTAGRRQWGRHKAKRADTRKSTSFDQSPGAMQAQLKREDDMRERGIAGRAVRGAFTDAAFRR
jgi:hypothetical protein